MARLLWRGSVQLHEGDEYLSGPAAGPSVSSRQLHGLALVAASFDLSTSLQAKHQQHDPDDPFSSSSSPSKTDTTAELCLDLEMLRNSPLYVDPRRARVKVAALHDEHEDGIAVVSNSSGTKTHGRKALKKNIEMLRKGKARASSSSLLLLSEEVVYVDVEQDSNLSLYIDERCQETVHYFNDFFCKEAVDERTGRTKTGLAVALEKEDELGISSANTQRKVVIYGQVAPGPHTSRPVMCLHVAKYRNKRLIAARPDAPAPRENLFAQKLRRTVSQPNMILKGAPKSKALKEKHNGPLSGAKTSALQADKARNLFSRSQTAPDITKLRVSSGKASLMQAPLVHGSPGRRGQKRPRLTAGGLKALQEVTENDTDLFGGHEDLQGTLSVKRSRNDRDGSPTPSVATNRSFASTTNGAMKAPARRGGSSSLMKRSMSMPPGRLDFASANKASTGVPEERGTSLAPTEMTLPAGEETTNASSIEMRNKGAIRKVLLAAMITKGCGREHEDFREVFSVAYKGLQCAFRNTIITAKLEKETIGAVTERHLAMYLDKQ